MCAFDWHHDDRWQWMTLKVRIFEEFRGITQILEATAAKRIKIDPYCQRQRCNPLNVLFSIRPIPCVDLPYSFLARGLHIRTNVARLA